MIAHDANDRRPRAEWAVVAIYPWGGVGTTGTALTWIVGEDDVAGVVEHHRCHGADVRVQRRWWTASDGEQVEP